MKGGENFKVIPEFWNDMNNSSTGELLEGLAIDFGMLGICMHFSPEQDSFTYFIGIEKGAHGLPQGLEVEEIPSSTWAVFDVTGAMPDAIQDMTKKIHAEWFPATGYQHAGTPEMEVYLPQEISPNSAGYRTQIWIPVVKK
ncbi:GyrI-like domain-containing protein [Aquibacillus koreensis]|uniref:GyrI-like domain-containing protein n=1 Tax=Aquibacillus koreensis TaxID=279446 RepID=A0A9X4AK03_9BACI|nr:GyrI-like domain-containing protein [Aquibacillus koreensis]MCT2538163.1 GyrI-like domain-containing protein [Aquibacillus koreensis]MDC3420893.1 GyrI-like domain-containing protein [Aquibacillus koreensis]